MKAVVAAFNQEKALVGAFSVITNLRMEIFEALVVTCHEPDVDLELEARHGEGRGGGGGAVGGAGEHGHQVRPRARHRRHPAPATQSDTDIFNTQCRYFPRLPDELRRGGDQLAVVHSEAVPQGVALRPQPQARVSLWTNHSSVLANIDQSQLSIGIY